MNHTILVVDDDEGIRIYLDRLLRAEGYRVMTACDGRDALDCFVRRPPDLVLLDIRMDGIDGLEVCRRLKQSDATRFVPVVLLTALSTPADRVRGWDAGADDFLNKPIDRQILLARISMLLRARAELRRAAAS